MEFNAKKKCHILEMGESEMRSTWTYKVGHNILSIKRRSENFGVVIQDNLSPKKHIERIFSERMIFHFLDICMMRRKNNYFDD